MMKKKLLLMFFLFFFTLSLFAAKKMIIVFKDGREMIFETSEIAQIYYSEETSDSVVSGKWQGDSGIKNIYINEEGIFSIQLDNGYAWSGPVIYQNDSMIFRTPFPIPVEYFLNYDIPQEVAVKAREIIKRPDEWLLSLSKDRQSLTGQKNCFLISWSGERLFDIDYVQRRSEWRK